MPATLFGQIKHALKTLKPAEVRAEAERDVRIGLIASSSEVLGDMETFLAPAHRVIGTSVDRTRRDRRRPRIDEAPTV